MLKLRSKTLAAVIAAMLAGAVHAEESASRAFNIDAQSLNAALSEFARQSQQEISVHAGDRREEIFQRRAWQARSHRGPRRSAEEHRPHLCHYAARRDPAPGREDHAVSEGIAHSRGAGGRAMRPRRPRQTPILPTSPKKHFACPKCW